MDLKPDKEYAFYSDTFNIIYLVRAVEGLFPWHRGILYAIEFDPKQNTLYDVDFGKDTLLGEV